MEETPRADVFISCGQQKGTEEEKIARDIYNKLEELGFKPYLAISHQSPTSIRENVFQKLNASEYLIFIDFKREKLSRSLLSWKCRRSHRGSLFANQELAIASFLKIDYICFQEEGIKERDGVLGAIQANCIKFTDRKSLPEHVIEEVKKRRWKPDWKNELSLEEDSIVHEPTANIGDKNRNYIWYHIKVKNHHWQKWARGVTAYLESIEYPNGKKKRPVSLEFKWQGVWTPRVNIPPESCREFDAFLFAKETPNKIILGINHLIIDYSEFYPTHPSNMLEVPGTYYLTYKVYSDNFFPVEATFVLVIGSSKEDIKFYLKHN